MFEPFLNHVSVSGGFPAHLQFRVTSVSTSTVVGCGSTNRIGPTGAAETDTGVNLEHDTRQRCVSALWLQPAGGRKRVWREISGR